MRKPMTTEEIKLMAEGHPPGKIDRDAEEVIMDLSGRWAALEVLERGLVELRESSVSPRQRDAYDTAATIVRKVRLGK
ncbi:hypothetical protein IME_EC2_55 [Enterobacteria phage IME_EC2]|uniref:Uncharacterized protein n=2 Tax=Murrayvirus EC2 TaxID=2734259 RepID=A0A0A0P5R0_9CAUD|nr:hypothetical protein HOQ93_gp55 [Enterobacteria phage IME_EC2]AGZ17846.1 hypothetical protein IME_EC2_55 [Enterobacteria phage IME_EC2]QHR72898.1 hypothetical protein sortsyn_33 [Escherichia phage sortsyn]